MKKELRDFGLTDNEIQVYLALVEMEESTVTPIRQKTELHTSRIYEALISLVKKGLVSYYMKNNVKQYIAQNPKVMYDILDDKKEQLEKIMPQIIALKDNKPSTDNVSMFEGYKAFKQVFNNILYNLDIKDEILVLGAKEEEEHFLNRTFFEEYNKRRIKKKIKMKLVFNSDAIKTAKKYSKFPYTEVRIMKGKEIIPTGVNIYPESVSILVPREKPTVFQINCKEVAESYRPYFKFVWDACKKVE